MPPVFMLRSSGSILGAERVLLGLGKALPRISEFEAIIGVLHDERDPEPMLHSVCLEAGLRSVLVPTGRGIPSASIASVREVVRDVGACAIHTHGYKEDVLALAARTGLPLVATNHLWKNVGFLDNVYRHIDVLALSRFDTVVAVSNGVLTDMRAFRLLRNVPMRFIPNGVDPGTRREPRETHGQPLRAVVVASLTPEKGHATLLDAIGTIARGAVHLTIVGAGPEREDLERQIRLNGLEGCVELLGQRNDVDALLDAHDVFVLPSFREGTPMAILEAMRAARPVIATSVGGVPDLVESEVTGLLVDPGDSTQLGAALMRCANDSALRTRLGVAGRQRAIERFSVEAMARAYADAYRQALWKENQ